MTEDTRTLADLSPEDQERFWAEQDERIKVQKLETESKELEALRSQYGWRRDDDAKAVHQLFAEMGNEKISDLYWKWNGEQWSATPQKVAAFLEDLELEFVDGQIRRKAQTS